MARTAATPPPSASDAAPGSAELGAESMNAARALLDLPLGQTRDMLQLIEASMHQGEQTIERMVDSLRRALAEAQSAKDLLELGTIQWRLATEQAASLVYGGSLEFDRWLGAGAQTLARTPRLAQTYAHRFGIPANFDPADDMVYTPLAALENARSHWSYSLRQWAETVRNGAMTS